ncbi:MAG TPA: AbrB/MazE/SpoVT family DNA-binding domain-containing protein [Blastocatellia bacterium]|nr:AbrB/MazE/SpoVT family DNA-binding domain-containing protein [Blastocatellia bacterium]
MANTGKKAISIARLSENGQITIPDEYRRALALSTDSSVVLVQVGDALVVAPYDDALAAVTSRLEAQMKDAGVDLEELVDAAKEARAEIAREEFGEEDTQ